MRSIGIWFVRECLLVFYAEHNNKIERGLGTWRRIRDWNWLSTLRLSGWWVHVVLLCFIHQRVRKIRNKASSCAGIFSRTLRFHYVARSPSSPLPHLLNGHRKLVGYSAIPASSCPGPVQYPWGGIVELQVPPDETPWLKTLHPHNANVLQSITYAKSPYPEHCFIKPRVRKIRNEASCSCPGIFSKTLLFYYVLSSPSFPLVGDWAPVSFFLYHDFLFWFVLLFCYAAFFLFFPFFLVLCRHTASAPITAGTHTSGVQ